ncbi:LolU-1 [Thelonectria olida]|uniref:LolU-1 n=1 Tax=Thelonectria olida TaxID=1576542 RepID=A0A9P8W909_9HYPO|nr:LolU-1 [Thelonectria olida]
MRPIPPGWSSAANGAITRPLDVVETWLHRMVAGAGARLNRDPFAITLRLKLKFPSIISDPTPYLRRTWLVSRHLHPQLGALYPPISAQQKNVTIPPLDPVEWLKSSFTVHQGDAAVFKSADDAVKTHHPTPTATAHWLPATSELLIRTTHLRLDGMGLFRLTHSFMTSLASVMRLGLDADVNSYPSNITEPTPSPGMGDATKIAEDGEPTPEYATKAIDEFIGQYDKGKPGIALPIREGSEKSMPANTRRLSSTLDKTTTSAIREACKDNGISIATAVQTSLIRAVASFPQQSTSKDLLIRVATDLRQLLAPHYNDPEYAVGLYVASFPSCIPDGLDPKLTFVQLAQKINPVFTTDLTNIAQDNKGRPVSFLKILEPYLNREFKLLTELPHDSAIKRSPGLSSVGLIEKFLEREYSFGEGQSERVDIESMWIAVDNIGQLPAFHIFTFRDQMTLQACFNESYYEDGFMNDVIERIKVELVNGLGIRAPISSRL